MHPFILRIPSIPSILSKNVGNSVSPCLRVEPFKSLSTQSQPRLSQMPPSTRRLAPVM
jgi:hypothetical protein